MRRSLRCSSKALLGRPPSASIHFFDAPTRELGRRRGVRFVTPASGRIEARGTEQVAVATSVAKSVGQKVREW
jgi:hypothetical protein